MIRNDMSRETIGKVSAAELYRRYVWLADTINSYGPITLRDIREKWAGSCLSDGRDNLPARTFQRYLEAIETMFGIDVECNRYNEYYIVNQDDFFGGGMKKWILESMSLSNTLRESVSLKDRIMFEEVPSGQKHLATIIGAMREGVRIIIRHHSYWRNDLADVEVDPYALRIFSRRWYLIGYSHRRNAMRTFALDRIESVEKTFREFEMPEDFSVKEYFRGYYGIITDVGKVETVDIRVSGNQQQYLRSLPLHPSQTEIKKEKDWSVFRFRLRPTFDFRQELLSRGANLEVLSPEWFRQQMADEIRAMARLYDSPASGADEADECGD